MPQRSILFMELSSSIHQCLLLFSTFAARVFAAKDCLCTDLDNRTTQARDQNPEILGGNATFQDFIALASYAPIALFAENLRAQKALIQSIITPLSISPLLTGCVKDLEWLWKLNAMSLFNGSVDYTGYVVASMRHGNNFPLANAALLKAIGIIGRPSKLIHSVEYPEEASRPTTVNVTFMVPHAGSVIVDSEPGKHRWQLFSICTVVLGQWIIQVGIAALAAIRGLYLETILMAIPTANLFMLQILRLLCTPKLADARRSVVDARLTVAGGAAVDAHIVARNWNSCHIDVICGYSSHVHALTNIPVAVRQPRLLLWSGRFLAVSLSMQAASLAYVIGRSGVVGLSATAWLVLYVLMLLPQKVLECIWPLDHYRTHLGNVEFAGTAQFATRRSALAFIAMLPVNYRVNHWDWVDVFMPRNARRVQWQADLETSTFIGNDTDSDRQILARTKTDLVDAHKVYEKLQRMGQLLRFQMAVGI